MHADGVRVNDLPGCVIGCAFTVPNTLGTGFLEEVYESVSAIKVRAAWLAVAQKCSASVHEMTQWSASTSRSHLHY